MATQLNTFKTRTQSLNSTGSVVYTTPVNYTSVVILAQVSNTTGGTSDVTFIHRDNSGSTSVDSELVSSFELPAFDATSVLTGKLVVEEGNQIIASSNDTDAVKLTISILETLNES